MQPARFSGYLIVAASIENDCWCVELPTQLDHKLIAFLHLSVSHTHLTESIVHVRVRPTDPKDEVRLCLLERIR